MKTLTHVGICLVAFFLSGCIKDPDMPSNPVTKPAWLLEKITFVTTDYESPFGSLPTQHFKRVYEFTYDQHYKPSSRKEFAADIDTLNLQLKSVDTFLYDASLRVTEVRNLAPGTGYVNGYKQFSYSGSDSLPATYEHYRRTTTDSTLRLVKRCRYAYEPAVVHEIYGSDKPDTISFFYDPENYLYYKDLPDQTEYQEYYEYGVGPAPEKFLNISNGLAVEMPLVDRHLPRMSKGNWITKPGRYEFLTTTRTMTYNADGLPLTGEVIITLDITPSNRYKVRYEYRQVE